MIEEHSISVGLDFGTHQTKICLQNTDDPMNPTYEFFEFDSPHGPVRCLPSVVQINRNGKVTYGFVDESMAASLEKIHRTDPPVLNTIEQPKVFVCPDEPQLPKRIRTPKPVSPYVKDYEKQLAEWKLKAMEIEIENRNRQESYNRDYAQWLLTCKEVERKNLAEKYRYRLQLQLEHERYEAAQAEWNENDLIDMPATYRYFKIATFSKKAEWPHAISPKVISAWYLAYVLFLLKRKLGLIYFTQMGIPQSIEDTVLSEWQKNNANDIYYAAYRLMMEYGTLDKFLAADYRALQDSTSFSGVDPGEWPDPGLLVLPEAYAGLLAVTTNKQIEKGLTMLVDIGGGSTDVSLFYINPDNDEPNISIIHSVHKGLNTIFESFGQGISGTVMNRLNMEFSKNREEFSDSIDKYFAEIQENIYQEIIQKLLAVANENRVNLQSLFSAIKGRPVVYAGGGSIYGELCRDMILFSDVVNVTKEMLHITNLINRGVQDKEFPILSVAYGLCIPQLAEPDMKPLGKMFSHIEIEEKENIGYEHGITDL